MNDESREHQRVVVDQFTRQADSFREFAEMPGQPREMVVAATGIGDEDTVLDVACGPGGKNIRHRRRDGDDSKMSI